MSEELSLITELAIILIAAGTFTVISKALKQPLILGYIIAGFIVGPHLGLFPQFSAESVHQWSEIGIIFLLFSLGLEFSFKKLVKIGSSALITAGIKCIGMLFIGLIAGSLMGWTTMESIFLGGLMSMSSTTIIIKAYDDMGLKNKPYSSLIFGSLVFEDLIAVLLMVLLSTLAVSNKFAGGEMLLALGKLIFCLVLWFLVGIYVIPTLLKKARKFLNDEILLLTSIGLCFGMVVVANAVDFSSALGAFVMGSILSETIEGEHIERITTNIKDLFGAIFFVSVGMMVDPAVIAEHWAPVLIITAVAMTGILIFSTTGVLLAGKGLTTAVHAGFSLAQLGEFAFIIAGLGCSLGVMRDFIYPVVIAVSVITTFTTPYMIKAAEPVSDWLHRNLPGKLLVRIDPPQEESVSNSMAEQSEWKKILRNLLVRLGIYGVLLVAILILSRGPLGNLAGNLLGNWSTFARNLAVTAVTLLIMMPFIFGMLSTDSATKASREKLLEKKPNNKWPLLAIMLMRIAVAITFPMVAVIDHFDLAGWTLVIMVLVILAFIWLTQRTLKDFNKIEGRFIANLNEKEVQQRINNPVRTSINEKLAGYDVRLESVEVSPDYEYIGKSLRELPFRHTTGVNIVKIRRGSRSILIPHGDEKIFPGDILLAVGTGEQIKSFLSSMEANTDGKNAEDAEFVVENITLSQDSYLTGKSLREANLRSSGCMVISYLRNNQLTTNPKPNTVFETGDIVWLAGEKESVSWLK